MQIETWAIIALVAANAAGAAATIYYSKKSRDMIKNTLALKVGYTVAASKIQFTTAPAEGAKVTVDWQGGKKKK